MRSIGHFIGGREVKGTSGRPADVFEPMTGDVQAQVALASKAELRAAVENAKAAQVDWGATNPQRRDYGNGVAIFTRDGDAARDFAAKVNVGIVGINVPIPVPIAYYTFGGWKKSGFGDLNQHGPDSIRFYTKTKTARWPSGVKEGAEFSIPTMQ